MSVDFIEEWAEIGVSTWRALVDIFDEIGCNEEERAQQSVKLCEMIQNICQEQVACMTTFCRVDAIGIASVLTTLCVQVDAATQARDDTLLEFEAKQEDIQHLCVLLGKPPAKQQIDENDCIRGKIAALASLHTKLTEMSQKRQSQIDEISNQICSLGLELDEQVPLRPLS